MPAEPTIVEAIEQESKKTPYYPALDGVRGIAIVMVMVVHYLPGIFPVGWLGVQLFFVLSGFLITGILFDTHKDRRYFRNFYARRSLRIFPLYYGFLFALLLVVLLSRSPQPHIFLLWFVYLQNFFWVVDHGLHSDNVFIHGHAIAAIGHLWSLAVEEQFYLVWPFVLFFVKRRTSLIRLCIAIIALRIVLACWLQYHASAGLLSNGLIYRMLPLQCDSFLMGGVLALCMRRGHAVILRNVGLLSALGIVAYVMLLLLLHRYPSWIGGEDAFWYTSGFMAMWGMPLANLLFTLVIFAATQPGNWLFLLFDLSPLRAVGRISYGLYVYHLPVFVFCAGAAHQLELRTRIPLAGSWWVALVAAMITGAVSWASFQYFEKPFLKLKSHFVTSS